MHGVRIWLIASLVALMSACADLPALDGRSVTTALADTRGTRLGEAVAAHAAANPDKTGVYALADPTSAFAARALLAQAADRSLDVQYYIWHDDQTGVLLFDELWRAAERGVRVRLLLDDNGTSGLDATIAALDAHPNIEVRLYNPFVHRTVRALNFLTDFTRANRRMHNKSFTADNQAAIVGGRNVGDEYFGAGTGVLFADLDVIVVGADTRNVSAAFDLFWNSPSAYPAARVVGEAGPDSEATLLARFAEAHAAPESATYLEAVRGSDIVRKLLAGRLPFEWTTARLMFDDPAKTLDRTGRRDVLLLSELLEAVGKPQKSFDLVSPYFVPGKAGTNALIRLAASGVRVRVLTNSLAATDVSAVHAGYEKRRRALLGAGVRLYELKRTAVAQESGPKKTPLGSSSASLHAKTFAVDGRRIFVGSFNFDERSALLNTELGLLIDSPVLAGRLVAAFDEHVPAVAYEVRLAGDGGRLEWIEQTQTGEKRFDVEPRAGLLLRVWVAFLAILPIDHLL